MRHQAGNGHDAGIALIPRGLRDIARVAEMRKKDTLFRRGDPARAVYCVLRGEVHLTRSSAGGVETVVHRAGPGDFFGEASLAGGCYHCDAVCSVSGQTASFVVADLQACMAADVAVAMDWIRLLSSHLRAARSSLERLRLKGARQRILHYLHLESAAGGAAAPSPSLRAWAGELGLAEETLYRALADLEREGIIERRGRAIKLLDLVP